MTENTSGNPVLPDKPKEEKKASSEESSSTSQQTSKKMSAAEAAAKEAVSGYQDIAYAVASLGSDDGFNSKGDRKCVSASMIKLAILAELLEQADEGSVSLDETYKLASSDIVGGTAHISESPTGTTFTYDELAKYMIAYSDNTATNVIVKKLGAGDAKAGMANVNARAEELGLQNTEMNRLMMDLDSGVENYMSANDAAIILKAIANHEIASEKLCSKAEGYLKAQNDGEGLAEGLPSGVEFGHKTGDLDSVRNDAGIVYADDPYVIAFFSFDNGRDTANELMAAASEGVYSALN